MNTENRLILVAEDNDDDYFLLSRAFQKAHVFNPIQRVSDGQQAILYLSGASPYSDRIAYPFPYVVLLDLKMPIKHGFDVLEWMRKRDDTRVLPVVILSSSQQKTDVRRGYESGANAFASKSTTLQALTEAVAAIHGFWVKINCIESGPINRSV